MEMLANLRTAEWMFWDFLLPWGMVMGVIGFLLAWVVVVVLERLAWTRAIWNLPLFFVALAVFFGCVVGLILTP